MTCGCAARLIGKLASSNCGLTCPDGRSCGGERMCRCFKTRGDFTTENFQRSEANCRMSPDTNYIIFHATKRVLEQNMLEFSRCYESQTITINHTCINCKTSWKGPNCNQKEFRFNVAYNIINTLTNGIFWESPAKSKSISISLPSEYVILYLSIYSHRTIAKYARQGTVKLFSSDPLTSSESRLCGTVEFENDFYGDPNDVQCENFDQTSKYITITAVRTQVLNIVEVEAFPLDCSVRNGNCGSLKCTEKMFIDKPPEIICGDVVRTTEIKIDEVENNPSLTATTAANPVRQKLKCSENNGGCGDGRCVETNIYDQNGKNITDVKCYPPDKDNAEIGDEAETNLTYQGCFSKVQTTKSQKSLTVKFCFEYCSDTLFYSIKLFSNSLKLVKSNQSAIKLVKIILATTYQVLLIKILIYQEFLRGTML
ncbi:hypothetical protein HELRODRAFT_177768 [Helobdella robusta]|uniref:Uncharacterized protein n=1 Tax=Helobdella robusta TaxID=6412 RepID=T1FC81_HELRO|nr:hypothetical protein HELRODRAFT_177768 [Helobdella robusta]ESN97709.1 hypothetical protein HELRODRAFT_177768 [Helobdella robusta]